MRPFEEDRRGRTDLGVSVRKVANGFSLKINASPTESDLGKIYIASSFDELTNTLKSLFDGEVCEF